MAQLLFAGPVAGIIVLPIMIYHPLQLLVGAWLAGPPLCGRDRDADGEPP
jgi:sodium/bile acid cotransporter 7